MAKRRLLQWMRDKLKAHAERVVLPAAEKRALDAAYAKAAPLVAGCIAKRYPPSEMKVLKKWASAGAFDDVKLQLPNGVVTQFKFQDGDAPLTPDTYEHRNRIILTDASTGAAVEKWRNASEAYIAERKKRLTAYRALIDGAATVEDLVDVWPEAKGVLPAGSPPIPLGPEQIAVVKADQRERRAA